MNISADLTVADHLHWSFKDIEMFGLLWTNLKCDQPLMNSGILNFLFHNIQYVHTRMLLCEK